MDPQIESQLRPVKVGILGDRKAGKTYLARKLAGKSVGDQTQTTEITNYCSEGSQFIYVDTPTLDNQTIIDTATQGRYDILVFLFKECESFTKLYEFLVAVSQTVDGSKNKKVRFYWQNLKKVLFIYTDYQSTLPVQIDQLFPILEEEVSNFSKEAIIKTFVINKAAEHYDQLKTIIQEEPVHIDFHQQGLLEEQESEVISIGPEPIEELREVAVSGEEQAEQKAPIQTEENPHPVHDVEADHYQHQDHSDLIISKINEDKRSEIYKKIQKSFFQDNEQEEEVDGVPKRYQEVDIRASNNILEEFSRPQQSQRKREIELDKQIKEYNEEKIHRIEEQVDISEGQPTASNSAENHILDNIHSDKREEKASESKSQQELKKQQESIQFKRKGEFKEDEAKKQRREKEEEELYRQVVKEEEEKKKGEQKREIEQLEEVKDEKTMLGRQQQVKKDLVTEVSQKRMIQRVQSQQNQLQVSQLPINQTYIEEKDKRQPKLQQNAQLPPQQHLNRLAESEPQIPQRTQNRIPKIKSGIQPINIPKKQRPAENSSHCRCLIM